MLRSRNIVLVATLTVPCAGECIPWSQPSHLGCMTSYQSVHLVPSFEPTVPARMFKSVKIFSHPGINDTDLRYSCNSLHLCLNHNMSLTFSLLIECFIYI